MNVPKIDIKQLLEAGVHLGHKTLRWNPKMKKYIFGEKNSIHIIDLTQTVEFLKNALVLIHKTVSSGGKILIVSTKKQASEQVSELAKDTNQFLKNFINKQEIRIIRTIKWLENNWNNYDDSYLTMDQIAIACALDYTMFRFNDKWKTDSPKLNKWFSNFVEKDFMKSTLPREK